MSRLGDLLLLERSRQKMTRKQVAKMCGISEGYLKDVEEGRRIIQDDQARRILAKLGTSHRNEAEFSLDEIAATVDLGTLAPAKPAPKPVPQAEPKPEPAKSSNPEEQTGIWLDALSSVLKRVPVYNAVMKEIDHRLLPVLDGRIEGASPDKVFYLSAPDNSMRGFRILQNDLCLIVPSNSPIDGALMLVEYNQHRFLRKVKKLDAMHVLLQSYDGEYDAENAALPDVNFIGRVVKVEFTL